MVDTFQFGLCSKSSTQGLIKGVGIPEVVLSVRGFYLVQWLSSSMSFWTLCVGHAHFTMMSFLGGHFSLWDFSLAMRHGCLDRVRDFPQTSYSGRSNRRGGGCE